MKERETMISMQEKNKKTEIQIIQRIVFMRKSLKSIKNQEDKMTITLKRKENKKTKRKKSLKIRHSPIDLNSSLFYLLNL